MSPHRIAEAFYVPEDARRASSRVSNRLRWMSSVLTVEKKLSAAALPERVSLASRGRHHPWVTKSLSEGERSVLAAPVRVVDGAALRLSQGNRNPQGMSDGICGQVVPHRPAAAALGEDVHDRGREQPALPGGDAGDVCRPESSSGRAAVKSRFTRSEKAGISDSLFLTFLFPLLDTPSVPISRIRRATRFPPVLIP